MTSHMIKSFVDRDARLLESAKLKEAQNGKSSDDCVFCAIVTGVAPAFKVYEDEFLLAFLDINPIRPYHTILIPKLHYERLHGLPPHVSSLVGQRMPRLARALSRVTKNPDLNIVSNQGYAQSVPHVHWHFVPAPDLRNLSSSSLISKSETLKGLNGTERNLRVLGIPGMIERRGDLEDQDGVERAKQVWEAMELEKEQEEGEESKGLKSKI